MAQVFIFGASTVYGVGGENGGWGDMIKQKLHSQMYGKDRKGEKHYVYNFAKSGVTVEFIEENFEKQIEQYSHISGKKIAIVSIGGNNARAVNSPDNFISTAQEYEQLMRNMLTKIKSKVDIVVCAGFPPVDESKTTPKPSSIPGNVSYFWNARLKEFSNIFEKVCKDLNISFVPITVSENEWKEKYLFDDGLHPNSAGHAYIFGQVWNEIEKYV